MGHPCCLPNDIIMEILVRVPTEDVIRFKSLSKFWYSSISHPNFAKSHHSHVRLSIIFKTSHDDHPYRSRYYSIDDLTLHNTKPNYMIPAEELQLPYETVKLINSCRSLLLLQCKFACNQLCICNRVTGKCDTLPLIPVHYQNCECVLVHDASVEKYKVYGVSKHDSSNKIVVFTIGMETIGWRELGLVVTPPGFSLFSQPSFVLTEKELHWLATAQGLEDQRKAIFSIDIRKEEFKWSIVPSSIPNSCCYLWNIRGSLCLMTSLYLRRDTFQVWVLEDRLNCQWTKIYEINISSHSVLKSSLGLRNSTYSFLGILKILIHREDSLFLYDLKSQELRQITLPRKIGCLGGVYISLSLQ